MRMIRAKDLSNGVAVYLLCNLVLGFKAGFNFTAINFAHGMLQLCCQASYISVAISLP